MKDLVSVIIPTYKRSDKIERAIKSVVNQTYNNLEIIVVDDNANNLEEREKTRKIVQKYNNINLIENQTNLGGAISRNVGIENSNGDYVAFLDDDDEYLCTKIEKQIKLLKDKLKQNKNVGLIYCYKNIIDNNGKIKGKGEVNYEGNCLFEHMSKFIETTSTWLCTKEALYDSGLFENVKAHQDNTFLIKLLAKGYEVYRVPEELINFYEHDGEGITKINKKYIEYTKYLIEFKKKYYYLLTKEQIEKINYNDSIWLMSMYRVNKMPKEYCKELKKIIVSNRIRKQTIVSIFMLISFCPIIRNIIKFVKRK